ncbi:electron transfer flavoprotein subunit beta/FixA family protein [Corynebacterium caspium]|uniref:electron transfer flavoprotein subunit beta/FixA family protein n=1 Tax=Corynebacterium caspium TaxID=234828 RepID=UPI00037633E3|nr:electron transfer flavoprotein subunit beta/FixA family protein [Corynebacterium caspium]WKD59437.1 Electron transfer flavoprotein subunit beta [Corynebacterium caspium DSM 44850]
MSTIVVLVKHVPDTWSTKALNADNTLDRLSVDSVLDEINEFAVEQALRLRDDNPGANIQVVALTMGPAGAEEALRKALAMGVDDALHICDEALAGSDVLATSWTLNSALNTLSDISLIIAGNASSDGSMGALPGIIAEYRAIPALTQVRDLKLVDGKIQAVREDPHGIYEVSASLPAVVSVTDQNAKPRFPNFKGLMAAKKHPIKTLSIADIGVQPTQVGAAHAATAVLAANMRSAREAGEVIGAAGAVPKITDLIIAENLL